EPPEPPAGFRVQTTWCTVTGDTAINTTNDRDSGQGDEWQAPTEGSTLVALVAVTGEEHDPAISGWARRALTQHRGQTHAVFTKDAEGDESTVEASWSESANAVMVVVELDGVPPLVSVDTVGADAGALTADAVSITNPQDA